MKIDWLKVDECNMAKYPSFQPAVEKFLKLNEHLFLNEEEFYTFLSIAVEMINTGLTWICWGSIDSYTDMLDDRLDIWINNIRPLTKFKENNNEH